jgi:hypothetical protein
VRRDNQGEKLATIRMRSADRDGFVVVCLIVAGKSYVAG